MQRAKNIGKAMDAVKAAKGEPDYSPKTMAAAWERWLPGIPQRFDCQDMLAAFAPRPLLLINGDTDPVAPLPGVQEAWSTIEPAYRRAGARDHVRLYVAEKTGHAITKEQQAAIYEWFSKYLR
jgi:pimeloyl-ACP methyl ester carboxylesterase